MSLALQGLVAMTLLVAGAVAALPLLVGAADPRPDPAVTSLGGQPLRIVEAPGGRWYLRGDPIGRPSLEALLRRNRPEQPVQYLPSAALSIGEVSSSLRWLRRSNAAGAVLALPPEAEQPAADQPAAPPPPPRTVP